MVIKEREKKYIKRRDELRKVKMSENYKLCVVT